MSSISIIIPAVNEAANLAPTFAAIRSGADSLGSSLSMEIIVVDANSDDDTAELALNLGAKVLSTPRRQRAHQLNLGTRSASGEILLFLHADTRLPPDGLDQIIEAMKDPQVTGGGFIRFFDSPSRFLLLTCHMARWRSRNLGIFLGDQGIFVRRTICDVLGGFDEAPGQCEDLDFSRRLRFSGRVVALSGPLISSARRFDRRGPFRQTVVDLWLTAKYFLSSAGRPATPERAN